MSAAARAVAANGAARVPAATIAFVAAALVVSLWPAASATLAYERVPAAASGTGGAGWRALTGQLVHGAPVMAVLDLGLVLLCGGWLERRDRALALATMVVALLAVAAVVRSQPQVTRFEGASGLAAALFTAAALQLARTTRSGLARALALAAALTSLLKAALEQWGGWSWSSAHLPAGSLALPAAHLAGGFAGVAVLVATALLRRGQRER